MNASLLTSDFTDLATKLGARDVDHIVVADGSGTIATRPCGWACFTFSPPNTIRLHTGKGVGTNNFAELSPFVQAIPTLPIGRVLCVSDSELTVKCGRKEYSRYANLELWKRIDGFEANGYSLVWAHVRRNSNVINAECDRIAGLIRKEKYDSSGTWRGDDACTNEPATSPSS